MAMATTLPSRLGTVQQVVRRIKRKRVSWASQDQLCQIRMFLAEDAPFLAGVAQEQLQVKSSTFMHAIADLPPGFGGAFGRVGALTPAPHVNLALRSDFESVAASVAPAISWHCPRKIELNQSWHVEAGEGSHEVEAQKLREATTLEAIYPRSSAIPNSPVEPVDQGLFVDDRQIPSIPVTAPDEDSDGEENPVLGVGPKESKAVNASRSSNSGYFGPSVGTLLSEKEKTSSSNSGNSNSGIDTSLLLQLLANPSLVETLSGLQQQNKSMVNSPHGNAANLLVTPNQSVTGCCPPFQSAGLTSLTTPLTTATTTVTTSTSTTTSNVSSTSLPSISRTGSSVSPWLHQPAQFHQRFQDQMSVPPGFQQQYIQQQQQQQGRDEKYFKELIMQHGGGSSGGKFGQQQQQQQEQGPPGRQSYQQQQQQRKGNGYVNSNAFPPGFGMLNEVGSGGHKGRRVCAYFNTAKGCRNGFKCPFVHDVNKRGGAELMQQQQQQHKRMRGFVHATAAAAAESG